MKWSELRRTLGGKLKGQKVPGSKHERWRVFSYNNVHIGTALVSHGDGEMKSREIGNIARSLRIKEREIKEIVGCSISREQFCEIVSKLPPI